MKKLMFLFLVVAFVATMAGGAIAEEIECCDPCPDCSDQAELPVHVTVRGVSCLWICQENIPYVETVVPCAPGICWGDSDDFSWKVWATCCYPRHIVGWTKYAYATRYDVHFRVNFGSPYGVGWVVLPETEGATVAQGIHSICDEGWRRGEVEVGAGPNAICVCDGTAYLMFRIVDNFCETEQTVEAFVF